MAHFFVTFLVHNRESGALNKTKKYEQIQTYFKKRIQRAEIPINAYLPSEHDLCEQFSATRTTVRKALDELLKEGYIEKEHGRGSRVIERRKSLGLPTIKGFSGSTDHEIDTEVTQPPQIADWDPRIAFPLSEDEKKSPCVYFQRVRRIDGRPIILENTWYSANALCLIPANDFVEGSFFKTLSQKFHVEVKGVEQEIRSELATTAVAQRLEVKVGLAILFLSVRFRTSDPKLNLYGSWYCNTSAYPIVSSYFS